MTASARTATSQPAFDAAGLPRHGASWGGGVVVRGRSRGPGERVEVSPPPGFTGRPRRLLTGEGRFEWEGGRLYMIPDAAAAGEETFLVLEY